MTKLFKILTPSILLCSLIIVFSLNVYANHTHSDNCYSGTKHVCDGNETTYGSCYTTKDVSYHTHTGSENPNGPSGCYTKENITYHTHTNDCYSENTKSCPHTIEMGTSSSLKIMDYVICPNCGQEDFYGYTHTLNCNNTNITLYAGECDSCGNKGNATITSTIVDNNPAKISYTHEIKENVLKCGKTEQTIESKLYTLNCGKTEQTIEQTRYSKTCTKTNGAYYNSKGEKIFPTCHEVVVSIKPKTEVQTTFKPDFTIIATYLDGHIAEIKPTIANYNECKTYNNEKVTLTYTGFVTRANNKNSISTYIYLTSPVTPTPTKVVTATPTPTISTTPTPIITTTPSPTPTIETIPTPTVELGDDELNIDIGGSFILETTDPTSTITPTPSPTLNADEETSNIIENDEQNNNINEDDKIVEDEENEENNKEFYQNEETENKENDDKKIITVVIIIILLCFLFLLGLSILLLAKKDKKQDNEDLYENYNNINNVNNVNNTNIEQKEIDVTPPIINGSDNNYK